MKIDMRENRTHKYQHTYINELNISNKTKLADGIKQNMFLESIFKCINKL